VHGQLAGSPHQRIGEALGSLICWPPHPLVRERRDRGRSCRRGRGWRGSASLRRGSPEPARSTRPMHGACASPAAEEVCAIGVRQISRIAGHVGSRHVVPPHSWAADLLPTAHSLTRQRTRMGHERAPTAYTFVHSVESRPSASGRPARHASRAPQGEEAQISWQRGQSHVPRPPTTMRSIGLPQRSHGSPSRPYTWNSCCIPPPSPSGVT